MTARGGRPPALELAGSIRVAGFGVGLTLALRRRGRGHVSLGPARLMAPDVGERCRAITSRACAEDVLEFAAGWVEELAGVAKR